MEQFINLNAFVFEYYYLYIGRNDIRKKVVMANDEYEARSIIEEEMGNAFAKEISVEECDILAKLPTPSKQVAVIDDEIKSISEYLNKFILFHDEQCDKSSRPNHAKIIDDFIKLNIPIKQVAVSDNDKIPEVKNPVPNIRYKFNDVDVPGDICPECGTQLKIHGQLCDDCKKQKT